MDDGQIFCEPADVDTILRTIDEENIKNGLERGRGVKVKSVCRLVGPAECRARVDAGWRTEYVMESSILSPENDLEGHVLGINFDDADGISNQFREASSLACAARKQVKIIDDIPCELAVMQAC